jgi:hypothetical protein
MVAVLVSARLASQWMSCRRGHRTLPLAPLADFEEEVGEGTTREGGPRPPVGRGKVAANDARRGQAPRGVVSVSGWRR